MSSSSLWETAGDEQFPIPDKRCVIKLGVVSVAATAPFYQHFLGKAPTVITAERAEFESDDPAVRIILTKTANPKACAGHYGFQMKNTRFVEQARARLLDTGFKITNEDDVACCYAIQTKVWAADPEGNRWEFFCTTETKADEGCGADCICHKQLDRSFLAA